MPMRPPAGTLTSMKRLLLLAIAPALAQQNPSPMVEYTRPHPRLTEQRPNGRREALANARLFIPAKLQGRKRMPLVIHFHGAGWVAELAAARDHFALITAELGTGSAVYAAPFADRTHFPKLLQE